MTPFLAVTLILWLACMAWAVTYAIGPDLAETSKDE